MTRRDRAAFKVKAAIAHLMYYTGLLTLWQAVALRRKAVVLMYHRVLSSQEREATGSHPGIIVDTATFSMQMTVLKRRFRVVSLDDFAERMVKGVAFDSSSCLITFDDGWKDNFEHALPVLVAHALPAVVFLPVNYIGHHHPFWQEALTHLLRRAVEGVRQDQQRRERLEEILSPVGLRHVLPRGGSEGLLPVWEAVGAMKREDRSVIEGLVSSLSAELGVDGRTVGSMDGFMTWDEASHMCRRGIAFGSHGANHLILTRLASRDLEAEVLASKSAIEDRLSQRAIAFAYPNGDWNREVADVVRRNGFSVAFTTTRGFVSGKDDRFAVRRVNIHEDMTCTAPMFLARVLGLL